ncbi:glucose dehydrogenase [FAD, quinone]-like [Chrysoperla carnea]|uniref:glucose dehydrogenase [FAD, quinone]-like n=1 Tax=Chrysoperla carnea TaxID=189513 RepID=UPI001D082DAD|nr:glucose dehydrogenase [FAD, quinone]-like [Chrysoperla carnea]
MDIPGKLLNIISKYDSPVLWHDMSEPLKHAGHALRERKVRCIHGKGMGGTSSVNWMMYTRGNIEDYNRWARMSGDYNWSWKNIQPYFKKLENYRIPYSDPNYFGVDGPVHIEIPPYHSSLSRAALLAANQAGLPIHNINGPVEYGISPVQSSLKKGKRVSANTAYITPIKTRRNLHIKMNSFVTKILIDVKAKPLPKAFGVTFLNENGLNTVFAKKEVILCAGAINSPKLLMLSGIGPLHELKHHHIPVINDLPVGKNLFDHVGTASLQFRTNKRAYSPPFIPPHYEIWGYSHPLNKTVAIEQLFYFRNMNQKQSQIFNMRQSVYDKVFKEHTLKPGFMIQTILEQPKSRGQLRLRNANPFSSPRIDLNYFSEPEDLDLLVSGVKEAIRIAGKPALKIYEPRIVETKVPHCNKFSFGTDEYWRCAIRALPFTLAHFGGTCKMGRIEDSSTVVNTRLKVHGIKNLRVIDISVFPSPVSAHYGAVAMMIGEKGADIIKQDWRIEFL